MKHTCECTQPGHCPRYGRTMTARQQAICRGDVMTPERCAAIRDRWDAAAPVVTPEPPREAPAAGPTEAIRVLTRFDIRGDSVTIPAVTSHGIGAWSDSTNPERRRDVEPRITLLTVQATAEQRLLLTGDPQCCVVDHETENLISSWQAARGWLLARGVSPGQVDIATGLQAPGDLRRLTGDLANWLRRLADDPVSCLHRSAEPVRTIPCRPCKGASQVPAYHCGHFDGECTIRAFGAMGGDGKKLPVCLGCEHQLPPDTEGPKSAEAPHSRRPAPHRSPPLLQPALDAPRVTGFLFDSFGRSCDHMADQARGASVFLCCGGPSLADTPLHLLDQRGITIAAVNQCGAVNVRPHLWFSVDSPGRFHESLWRDPAVVKFTRRVIAKGQLRSRVNGEWQFNGVEARHCPNAFFYEHKLGFTPETFLALPKVAWGGKGKVGRKDRDTKSVFLVALRMLYWLGYRRVYLVGTDFHYRPEKTYSFAETKGPNACGTNNNTMNILCRWMGELRPRFEAAGFAVYNTVQHSRLTAFDHVPFADAVESAALPQPSPDDVAGMYSGC